MKKENITYNKKEDIIFKLIYHDGVTHEEFKFKGNYFDIIEFADEKLEDMIWGDADKDDEDEIRTWKRLDATTYRAEYSVPKPVMEAKFNACIEAIEDFLNEEVKTKEIETKLDEEANDFFSI